MKLNGEKLAEVLGIDVLDITDGYHSFRTLYDFRMLYNALLFNEWAKQGKYEVHKSYKHNDGELCFGGKGWFIVVALLPSGQITNHYENKFWNLFQIPEQSIALFPFDGHNSKDVLERMYDTLIGSRQNQRCPYVCSHVYCNCRLQIGECKAT